jgi:steroid 5-alpha reductase family enzyme
MNGMLLNYIVALVMCTIGFWKYIYFLSVGYGLSIAAIGLEMLIKYQFVKGIDLPWYVIVQLLLFIVYGIRLGGFLLVREIKNATYRKTLEDATKTKSGSSTKMPVPVMVVMWLMVAALYMIQTCPVYYRIENTMVHSALYHIGVADADALAIVGVIISAIGVLLEAIADKQKSAAKKVNPKRFCDSGLFKMCRCPNYFGEITFWTGVLVGSLNILKTWYQWVLAIFGYIAIVYIMLNGAKRLEKRQTASYGSDPEFQAYVKKTPIIFPLIPLYSLKDSKIIK